MVPIVEEVYRCPDCDNAFPDQQAAAFHCVEMPPKEYKCLGCGFVWSKSKDAIRCSSVDARIAKASQRSQTKEN